MKRPYESLSNELKKKNIRLSHRRSKTTVYNTLHILLEAGLIRVLTVEDNETRYDIMTETHGHFKCVSCGAIFDFKIDPDLLTAEELNGFNIVDRDVYFKGVCSKCLPEKEQ